MPESIGDAPLSASPTDNITTWYICERQGASFIYPGRTRCLPQTNALLQSVGRCTTLSCIRAATDRPNRGRQRPVRMARSMR